MNPATGTTRNERSLSRLVVWCLGLLLLAACSQTPTPLGAEEISTQGVTSTRFKGEGAFAYLYEETECGYTYAEIFVNNAMVKFDKERDSYAFAAVDFFSYDWCEGSYRSGYAGAELNPGEFQIDKKLESATLRKTFWIDDSEGGSLPLTVDVTWSAEGPLRRVKESEQFKEPGHKFKYRYNGSERDATASGTFSLPGDSFMLSGSGHLYTTKAGYLEIVQENKLPPVIEDFNADPYVILPGECSTLSWSVLSLSVSDKKPIVVTIDQGIGNVAAQSSVVVCPEEITTYTLTATNRNGSTSESVTVYVLGPDVYEPNDSPEFATPIDLYTSLSDLVLLPGDVDWFTFEVVEPTQVYAYLYTWDVEPVMELFDSALNEIATGDWYLEVPLEPGTYYLAVSGSPDTSFAGEHEQQGFYYLSIGSYGP